MRFKVLSRCFLAVVLTRSLFFINAAAAPGDLYVADFSAGTIYKFTPAGVRTTFASGINQPTGLAFDRDGNLFVVENGSRSLLKFTPDGSMSTFASGLNDPIALTFDGTGNLFVTESSGDVGQISKFTPAGAKSTFVSGGNFVGLAFDTLDNLFAATAGPTDLNGGIVWFTPDGTPHTLAPSGGPGMAFNTAGDLFVTSSSILKYNPAHDESVFTSQVSNPIGLAFDNAGNLFVVEEGSGAIFKFTPSATKTTFASGLSQPRALAFEPVTEKLRNLSARGFVQSGENVLIAGLIVGGNALATNAVVLRAIGPSLSHSGITNPLQDPTLELRNSSGILIASNDNWEDTQKAQIEATGLAPTDARESAIFAALPAGAFTAIVRGANNSTGVALVEVYNLTQ